MTIQAKYEPQTVEGIKWAPAPIYIAKDELLKVTDKGGACRGVALYRNVELHQTSMYGAVFSADREHFPIRLRSMPRGKGRLADCLG